MSTEGVLALAPPLCDRPALTLIDMCNNDLWDRGVKAVADAIRALPALTTVQLGNNRITATGTGNDVPPTRHADALLRCMRPLYIALACELCDHNRGHGAYVCPCLCVCDQVRH
jgi:hypothetical protein